MAILYGMAKMTIKSTYTMDVETVRTLEDLARRWNVPKSEALRRAIRIAANDRAMENKSRLDALDALQRSVSLTKEEADRWVEEVRAERRASTEKRLLNRE